MKEVWIWLSDFLDGTANVLFDAAHWFADASWKCVERAGDDN